MIDKEAAKKGIDHVDVLLEVNVSGEESKFGLTPQSLMEQIDDFLMEHIKPGLMTVAPYTENPGIACFLRRLWQLSVDIQNKSIDNNIDVSLLSMGMSGDFETAIEEGATHVRVGTSIFGARDYSR